MQNRILSQVALAGAALLAGCAAGTAQRQEDTQVRDRYAAYAGEPIDHFSWLGRYDGWELLGRYELVVFTGLNDAYLIKVDPPCPNLSFANRVGLTSSTGAVHTRFDYVLAGDWRCPIAEIRRIDYRRMRADLRQEHQKAKGAQ